MRVHFWLLLALALVGHASSTRAQDADVAARCAALAAADFGGIPDAPSHILKTALDASHASCEAEGYVSPNIGFVLRLPLAWNGKFGEVGCGGFCGSVIAAACDDLVARGYACLATDLGHKSTGADAKWAYNNLQAELDFAYRATHVLAVAGKAIAAHYYGKEPARSYFLGCSTGGRQGFHTAQNFPGDFDGIVAGAPVSRITGVGLSVTWASLAFMDREGKSLFTPQHLNIVHEAVMARCDGIDGAKDGVIDDPRRCSPDISALVCKAGASGPCLDSAQSEALRKLYGGPVNSKGEPLFPGRVMPGSELEWRGFIGSSDQPSGTFKFMRDMFRYMNFLPDPGPQWNLRDIDWDKDPPRLEMMEALYNAENPDMRKFKARGGKLIAYQGWNDPLVLPENVIAFYELAEKTMGGSKPTRDFFRLFMVPGMGHCGGGQGPNTIDYLAYLEDWVEKGIAPDKLLAVRDSPAAPAHERASQRHLQPYPLAPQ